KGLIVNVNQKWTVCYQEQDAARLIEEHQTAALADVVDGQHDAEGPGERAAENGPDQSRAGDLAARQRQTPDRYLEEFAERLFAVNPLVELSALNVGYERGYRVGTVAGYFNDTQAFVKNARALSGDASGVYFSLHQLRPDIVEERAFNTAAKAWHTVANEDVT